MSSNEHFAIVKLGAEERGDLCLGADPVLRDLAMRVDALLTRIRTTLFDADSYVIPLTGFWSDAQTIWNVAGSIQGKDPFRELSVECELIDGKWAVYVDDRIEQDGEALTPEPILETMRELHWQFDESLVEALQRAERFLRDFLPT